MKRPWWMVLVCSVAVQLLSATPAQAWWEYIEALSGPDLHGPHVDARIVCFMEERKPEGTQALFGLIPAAGVKLPCLKKINNVDGKVLRRRFSIDGGFRYHWDNSFEYARGKTIHFASLGSVFTWYPEFSPKWDILDLSAGGGAASLVSEAFSPVYVGFFDLRSDVHLPSVWRFRGGWRRYVPALRLGMMVFPSGFEENAFGRGSKRMEGPERGAYWGIFFDLDAFSN